MEKAYKTMSQAGAGSIVIGIITIVTGVTAGIIAIVNGAVSYTHLTLPTSDLV